MRLTSRSVVLIASFCVIGFGLMVSSPSVWPNTLGKPHVSGEFGYSTWSMSPIIRMPGISLM